MLNKIIGCLRVLRKGKRGQGMVEYVFIISLISLVVILGLGTLGYAVLNFFTSFANQIP